jgi:hypothetical protein
LPPGGKAGEDLGFISIGMLQAGFPESVIGLSVPGLFQSPIPHARDMRLYNGHGFNPSQKRKMSHVIKATYEQAIR